MDSHSFAPFPLQRFVSLLSGVDRKPQTWAGGPSSPPCPTGRVRSWVKLSWNCVDGWVSPVIVLPYKQIQLIKVQVNVEYSYFLTLNEIINEAAHQKENPYGHIKWKKRYSRMNFLIFKMFFVILLLGKKVVLEKRVCVCVCEHTPVTQDFTTCTTHSVITLVCAYLTNRFSGDGIIARNQSERACRAETIYLCQEEARLES